VSDSLFQHWNTIDDSSTVRESRRRGSPTLEEWTSVLHLSTMWRFQKIRSRAINAMGSISMDLVDKIVIARKYDVSAWLVSALSALVQREKSVDFSEGNKLGLDWVLKVAELRDGSTRATTTSTCPHCNYTGPRCCNSCYSTANRCGLCHTQLNAAATTSSKGKDDLSDKIRKAFGLEHTLDDSA
jgi:hypothetical protein